LVREPGLVAPLAAWKAFRAPSSPEDGAFVRLAWNLTTAVALAHRMDQSPLPLAEYVNLLSHLQLTI